MTFVFYDTETTGTDTAFDQILQFGAIRTDDDLNEIDRFEIRCRLQPHIVPAPMALKVTGIRPGMLLDPVLPSHYEAMRQVHAKLSDWSPSVFVGYNSISFDENLLRQAFYQTLQSIYLTNTGGNTRADMLRIAHAVAVYAPNAIAIPLGDAGQQVFRLDRLSPANGFDHAKAHDAMGDVDATIHLAKLVREYIQKGQASQSWYLRPAGTHQGKTAYLIVNAKSGKCLDGPGNEFGKLYHIWGCDPNNANQRFIINTVM